MIVNLTDGRQFIVRWQHIPIPVPTPSPKRDEVKRPGIELDFEGKPFEEPVTRLRAKSICFLERRLTEDGNEKPEKEIVDTACHYFNPDTEVFNKKLGRKLSFEKLVKENFPGRANREIREEFWDEFYSQTNFGNGALSLKELKYLLKLEELVLTKYSEGADQAKMDAEILSLLSKQHNLEVVQ